ncbi:hypothetical protein A8C56_08320 [Niabella ginsenosidivorans]|uniref:DUF2357 domain-containing protein n=1 Tax=Niabella ginsenosidivorans TaxID=1176587 RepID=A0A1A9I0F6_9BACT|nr:DUF2357 domain-containing protein [Niabella ginsenosidivorans]ANH80983.1 hypothetical protein A8C56_08320 [Niabella ginsenosidivorans]
MKAETSIEINLDSIATSLRLYIDARKPHTLFDGEESAAENNEARYQLVEGAFYDYAFNNPDYQLGDVGESIITPHKRNPHTGTLAPNIFTGTLTIPILHVHHPEPLTQIELEVQSVKTSYRNDYRDMLEFIMEQCTDLILQSNAPVVHSLEVDYSADSHTLYQQFAFIQSVIGTGDFAEAIHRIVTAPVTQWADAPELKDVRRVRRLSNAQVQELLKGSNRTELLAGHALRKAGLTTIPQKITTVAKTDTVDTPENRFVKHALEVFLKFCTDVHNAAAAQSKLYKESFLLIRTLEGFLHHSFFTSISAPTTLRLNSPVLQRKEGYREVLRTWLLFQVAAKLVWQGGDDVYRGGKKDVATLYEYWLFFKLLSLFRSVFKLNAEDIHQLIEKTEDGLNLRLKQGRHYPIQGVYDAGSRKLSIRFSYNRTFSGVKDYPHAGSYTSLMRPDYTLSFWPAGITEAEAEQQELITHIHFDAKYKIDHLNKFLEPSSAAALMQEKKENNKGIYKNADLLKMHAYKDAIRRTGGAYVLYPGHTALSRQGFHEIIPGLGAFPVRPSKTDDGIGALKAFILAIIDHFINRTSQREKWAYHTFDVFKEKPVPGHVLQEPLPEPYGPNRDLLPDDIFVLIGYYKSAEQLEWIQKHRLYNFRTGSGAGALVLDRATVSARYLLLHTSGQQHSGQLWKIVSKGPRIFSRQELVDRDYPSPTQDHYLVINLEPVTDPEFHALQWNFKDLPNYATGRPSAFPFTATLAQLMKVIYHGKD